MQNIVIMGIGNVLYGDEGFGVHAVASLAKGWDFPPQVQLIDGGTQGHSLLTFVEETDKLLLLDAVDFGEQGGSICVRKNTGIPAYLSALKVSPHQNSFSEILALAQLRDKLPAEIVLIGVHPVDMTMGQGLTPEVREKMPTVMQLALEQLLIWGISPKPSTAKRNLYHPELANNS